MLYRDDDGIAEKFLILSGYVPALSANGKSRVVFRLRFLRPQWKIPPTSTLLQPQTVRSQLALLFIHSPSADHVLEPCLTITVYVASLLGFVWPERTGLPKHLKCLVRSRGRPSPCWADVRRCHGPKQTAKIVARPSHWRHLFSGRPVVQALGRWACLRGHLTCLFHEMFMVTMISWALRTHKW